VQAVCHDAATANASAMVFTFRFNALLYARQSDFSRWTKAYF
jgi:hypothetical protein